MRKTMRSWAPMIESNFTSQSISLRRLLRRLLAILFAAATTTYSVLWITHVRQAPRQPGFVSYEYSAATLSMVVGGVVPGSPAHKAGLQTGDRVVAIDEHPLESLRPFYEAVVIGQKDVVDVTAERPAAAGGRQTLQLVLRGGKPAPRRMSSLEVIYPGCAGGADLERNFGRGSDAEEGTSSGSRPYEQWCDLKPD